MRRDGLSREEAERRMSAQFSEEFFIAHCDDILYNNGSADAFQSAVRQYAERWCADEQKI